jgi:outer membrane protein assembly factor BamB
MAAAIGWDGRLWVNGSLVWRPDRLDTPNKVAVFPVDLAAGENRITVSCSARPIQDGNMGNMGARIHKYAERMYGAFSVWTTSGGAPRSAAEIAAAAQKERAGDVARAAAATPVRGHRGDGSGFYPTARPPVAWDLEKNINVRWKVSLPTRDAEPVIVGKNLFLTTVAGELACLDADTGAERWRKQPMSNGAPVPLPPPPTSVIGVTYDRDRQWPKLGAKNPAPGDLPYDTAPYRGGFTNACLTALADLPAPDRAGGQAGGQRVWMHDHRGVVACFAHDGAQVWAQSVPAQVFRMASGQECRSRTVPPVPPAGVGPLLIVAAGDGLIAFDRASGAEKWRRLGLDYLGRFAPMDLGDGPRGRLLLLCSGEVLDAATGETLIRRCAPEMNDSACQPVVDGRVAYFHAGSAAVRFWVDGDGALCHRVLWDSPADVRKRGSDINSALHVGSFAPTPVLYKGLLLTHMADMMSIEHGPQNSMRVHASDAATGCAVSQRHCVMPNGMNPALSTIVAGDLMYCGDRGGKTFGNYPTFPETPRIFVMQAGEEPRRLATNPNLHTRSHPVCEGRRLYLAGEGEVVCIERPEPLGDRFSEYELAALQKEFYALEIGVKPETAEAVAIAPLDRLPEGTRAPVVPLFVGSQTIPWDKSSAPLCEGFPWQLVGAWPLPDAANDDVYAAMTGNAGKVVGEGCQVKAGDQTVAFRAVPPAGLTARKRTLECATMNYLNAVDTFALNTTNLFAVALPARGLFAAVLDNRRDWTLACDIPANARVWLGGHEIKAGEHLRLASGLYPFLIECRVDAETVKQPIGVRFYEYPPLKDWPKVRYNPAKEMARWLDRVRANEALLRAIAASGPTGAYAQEALDALASGSSRTH